MSDDAARPPDDLGPDPATTFALPIPPGDLPGVTLASRNRKAGDDSPGGSPGEPHDAPPARPPKFRPWLRLVSMSDPIPRDARRVNPPPKVVKRRAGGFRRCGGR